MKKGLKLVLIILVSFILQVPVLSETVKAKEATDEPISIGGSLPLTGIFSEQAKWVKAGYEGWVDNINKQGGLLGRPVKITIYDDEGAAEKAVLYYERAITVDKVDLLFGGYPGPSNVALMPLAEKYKKVFVGLGGQLKSFHQGFTYSFGSPPLMSEWIALSLAGIIDEYIPKAEWPKSIAILTMNNVSGLAGRENIIKAMEERGIKVVVNETYNLPMSDATTLVSKVKGRKADILCSLSFFDDAIMIMRAAKAMRYNPKLLFQLLASNVPAWTKELGKDGDYVGNGTFWHGRLPFAGNKEIIETAKARLGIPGAPLFFGFAYCWTKTLELGVRGAGTLDNTKIRDYLRSNKLDLPYGEGIQFEKTGLPKPYCFTTQTTNGRVELVWPQSIATTKFVYPRPPWSK